MQEVMASPLHRPIDVRFDPPGENLYVLDFGQFEMSERGVVATAASGALWRMPVSALIPR
jgi:hypothetical protein